MNVFDKKPTLAARTLCRVWLACTLFASFSFSAFDPKPSPELVYCPLQREWVERSPQIDFPSGPQLDEICADGNRKVDFLKALIANALPRPEIAAGELFLRYSESGERGLEELPSAPPRPDAPFAQIVGDRTLAAAFRLDLESPAFRPDSIGTFPRSPTFESAADFPPARFALLSGISVRTAARAPPLSL